MSTPTKPRGEAKLKTLPSDRQAEIIEHMRAHKLIETRAWLREDGLSVALSSLSEFWHWWHLLQVLTKNESTVEELLVDFRKQNPQASEAEVFTMGQMFFSKLALASQDADVWSKTQTLALKRNEQQLSREKFEMLKAKAEQADKAKAATGDTTLTDEEKQLKIRQIFGMV